MTDREHRAALKALAATIEEVLIGRAGLPSPRSGFVLLLFQFDGEVPAGFR